MDLSFLSRYTIKKRIILLVVLTSLILTAVISSITYVKLSDGLFAQKRQQIEFITEEAVNVAKMFNEEVKSGAMTLEDAQAQAKKVVLNMQYDGKNYIWINDYNGIMLQHPKAALIGKDFAKVQDKKGFLFVPDLMKQCKEKGTGFSKYYWTKPGQPDDKSFLKFSAARGFEEWQWMFATGVYVEDVEKLINDAMFMIIGISFLIALIVSTVAYNTIGISIITPITALTGLGLKLAENDLSIKIEDDTNKTEIGELNRSFKKFVDNLRKLLLEVTKAAQETSSNSDMMYSSASQTAQGADQVVNSVSQLASGATEQAHNVTKGVENINDINVTIQTISKEAKSIAELSDEAESKANEGKGQVKNAITKIDNIKVVADDISLTIADLGTLSSEIEQIVDLIKTIAGQTNLLALNAAIEAARAGEHGKGFAVVADEVKKLAGQSAEATDKITAMIKEIQEKTQQAVTKMNKATTEVGEGVVVVNEVGKALENIIMQVNSANTKIKGITKEINDVANNSEEVVALMESISTITEETAAQAEEISSITEEQTASVEEITASSQILAKTAEELANQITKFKL